MQILLFLAVPFVMLLIYTIVKVIRTALKTDNHAQNLSQNKLIFSELIFLVAGPLVGFLRFDKSGSDIPFSKSHVFSIIVITLVSIICYFISRIFKNKLSLIQKAILSVGILQGIILSFFTGIHFLVYLPLGLMFPIFGFELATPFMGFLLFSLQFYLLNKKDFLHPGREINSIESPTVQTLKKFLLINRFSSYLLLFSFLVLLEILFLMCLGQDSDSLIKAFQESRGFVFSNDHFQID